MPWYYLKKLVYIWLLFSFWFFSSSIIYANKDFKTSYFFTYTVSEEAITSVELRITIQNQTEKIYVHEYSLTIGSNLISQVKAYDDFGNLDPEVILGENYTTINLKLKEKVVGRDKKNNITVNFQTPDFATIKGQILEVNIPAIAQKEELNDFQVRLLVPSQFGPASFIRPLPNNKSATLNYQIYEFYPDRLMKVEGISAAFGEAQIFDFKFLYFLKNNNKYPIKTEISLPADTPFQRVFYLTLDPKPLEVNVDGDDNWLAVYKLSANQELEITATGSAELYIRSQQDLKNLPLSNNNLNYYLQAKKYWQVEDPEIKNLANELKTPENIYKYVAKNLIYDYGRLNTNIQRLGAKQALNKKQSALCTEFADLFITLCRAAGIPSREVAGYAYTINPKLRPVALNKDILHAWAEYYDFEKELWIPVDPTWEMTTGGVDYFNKLDLNHFAFVRHGLESDYPPPAGSYSPNAETKTIFIDFGKKKTYPQKLNLKANLPPMVIAGLPIYTQINILNDGPAAIHKQNILCQAPAFDYQEFINVLPPFSQKTINLKINTACCGRKKYPITINYGNKKLTYEVYAYSLPEYIYRKLTIWLKGN